MRVARTSNHAAGIQAAGDHGVAGRLGTGAASPLSSDSSAWVSPSTTTPSAGMRSPALTRKTCAGLERVDGDEALARRREDAHFFRHEAVEKRDGAGGAILGGALDHFAGENQRDDGGRGIEVDVGLAA